MHNSGTSNHWIGIKPKSVAGNTAAIGTRVTVVAGPLRQVRDIQGGDGGITTGDLRAHFGLGTATAIDSVIVRWPSGNTDVFKNLAIDAYNTVEGEFAASASAGGTATLNDLANSGAQITVNGGVGGATVSLSSSNQPPTGVPSITTSLTGGVGKYVDVQVLGTPAWPLTIRIYYTKNDLIQAGINESDLQGIYYWSTSTSSWKLYSNSLGDDQGRGLSTTWIDTTHVTINGVTYEGYVGASAYHLTSVTIGAKKNATAIDKAINVPTKFTLSQNFPNPFNPSTTVRYGIPKAVNVSLRIYNILGQLVSVLVDGHKEAGYYQVQWNVSGVPSGIYFCRLQSEGFVETRKLTVIK